MRIGILSDSHDHVGNLRVALGRLREEADLLIHCGDLCSPFIVPILAREFPGPVHAVFGNNDADRYRLQLNAAQTDRVRLHGEAFFTELGGMRFAVQHFDNLARPLAESGRYDVVCFGHDHRPAIEQVGAAWLINPGSILGYQPVGALDVDPTFVVFDTESRRGNLWRLREGGAERVGG
jgi:putative phosphoesterase